MHVLPGTDPVPAVMQTKTYSIFEEDGEPILHKAEGTEIQWKAGKNPTVKVGPAPASYCLAFACMSVPQLIFRPGYASDHLPLLRCMKHQVCIIHLPISLCVSC